MSTFPEEELNFALKAKISIPRIVKMKINRSKTIVKVLISMRVRHIVFRI